MLVLRRGSTWKVLGSRLQNREGGEPLENKVALVTRDPLSFLTCSESWPCWGYRSCLGETRYLGLITRERGGQKG